MKFAFPHGCGDVSNACHCFRPWLDRGHDIQIVPGPFKWLWEACGYSTTETASVTHNWFEPQPTRDPDIPWCGSKVGRNIAEPHPLPKIGDPADIWSEVLATRFDLSDHVSADVKEKVGRFLADLPRPVVALHTHGVTNPEGKDFPARLENKVIKRLRKLGSVVHLVQNGGVVMLDNYRVASGYDVETLYEIINQADLFLGIDSGPFHLARMTTTPRIGCWWGVTPWHASLPLPTDLNLFKAGHPVTPHRPEWNIREVEEIDDASIVSAFNSICIAESINTICHPKSKSQKTTAS